MNTARYLDLSGTLGLTVACRDPSSPFALAAMTWTNVLPPRGATWVEVRLDQSGTSLWVRTPGTTAPLEAEDAQPDVADVWVIPAPYGTSVHLDLAPRAQLRPDPLADGPPAGIVQRWDLMAQYERRETVAPFALCLSTTGASWSLLFGRSPT